MKLSSTALPGTSSSERPTAQFFRSSMGSTALEAALQGGWLDATDAMSVSADHPVPALAEWLAGQPLFNLFESAAWEHGIRWPANPSDPWPSVDAAWPGRMAWGTDRTEALVAWLVHHIPLGGLPTWVPREAPEGRSGHLLAAAVQWGWVALVDQLLRRADCPPPAALNALVLPAHQNVRRGSDTRVVPLLVGPLLAGRLSLVRHLLAAGVDPNQVDDAGMSALYHARSPKAVQLLLEHGADPHKKPPGGESLLEWWSGVLPTVAEAVAQGAPVNAWLAAHENPEETRRRRLPDIARQMENGTVTGMRKELSQLKIRPDSEWEEEGETWTLARRALGMLLERTPGAGSAPLAQGLAQGPLGRPLVGDLDNRVLLWLAAGVNKAAAQRLEGVDKGFVPSAAQMADLVEAWVTWSPPEPKGLALPGNIPKSRREWALAMGTRLASAPALATVPFHEHPTARAWAHAEGFEGFLDVGMDAACQAGLAQARARADQGDAADAGRWLCAAIGVLQKRHPRELGLHLDEKALDTFLASSPHSTAGQVLATLEACSAPGRVAFDSADQAGVHAFIDGLDKGPLRRRMHAAWLQCSGVAATAEPVQAPRRPRM